MQALEKEYGGFLNTTAFVEDYVNYVSTVVESFGDRVNHYLTFNGAYHRCSGLIGTIMLLSPREKLS
jgi:beta-glucosidase/6-phospho-beta-glucosidase/beta-galactosidase